MSATQTQVGGSHYKDMKIQPVDYIHANGLGFIEGSVIKYVSRHKSKGGKQDLENAKHFLELLIEREYPEAETIAGEYDVHSMFGWILCDKKTGKPVVSKSKRRPTKPKYRMLRRGEVVQDGDQFLDPCNGWGDTVARGRIVSVKYVGKYRRPIAKGSK